MLRAAGTIERAHGSAHCRRLVDLGSGLCATAAGRAVAQALQLAVGPVLAPLHQVPLPVADPETVMAALLKPSPPATGRTAGVFDVRLRMHPTPEQGDADGEPLASVVREVGRDQAADGVLVTWHEPGREPENLFAAGACVTQSATERDMMIAARGAAAGDTGQPVRWAPQGDEAETTGLLTTRVPAEGGVMMVTSVFRLVSHATRRNAREAAMRSLPMVQAFFRLWASRARAVVASRGLKAALDSSDVGTLLVDGDGRLVFVNKAAERILARDNGLRRAGALLSGTRLADTMRLQAAIEHVINGTASAFTGAPVVALHRKGCRPLLAAVVAADGHAADGEGIAAIVHVFDPEQEIAPLLDPVCRLYGLSPVEGRLATLLAGGATLAGAAKAMAVQEQTARSYLKQVFLKTDTNRQAELVWLMLNSAVRTAPGSRMSFL